MQWAILSIGFWSQVFPGDGEDVSLKKIPIGLDSLVIGDFGAAAGLITLGCVLGKVNLQ